jgi:preprotein translocase subunit SecB
MTTNSDSQAPAIPTPAEPFFGIQRVFLKGASLELPMGAKIFLETGAPALNLNLQVTNEKLADNVFQCSIRATLNSTLSSQTLFLLEVEQAGVFEARDLTAEQLADVQEIAAPTILAPYLRAQLADILTRATLPSFYMPEVNWAAMAHQNRFAQAEAAENAKSDEQAKLVTPIVLH